MRQQPEHVILVHGLGRRPASLGLLAHMLRGQGYAVTNWGYRSRAATLDSAADDLSAAYATAAQAGAAVNIVTHSMGAIVLRRLLARAALPQLGKVVMLAPPNNGSIVLRRLLRLPLVGAALGPAARELADSAVLSARCAAPTAPLMVIAGTSARDPRNPVSLLSAALLREPNDGTVTVRETMLPRMNHFLEVAACHTWIMNHPATRRAISEFLQL